MLICFPNTSISSRSDPWNKCSRGTFTFMHLADTFIQSDLQCIPAMHFWSVYFFAKSALVWPFSSRSDPSSKCTKCSSGQAVLGVALKLKSLWGLGFKFHRCQGQLFSKTLVAAMAKQRAFLGCIRRVSRRCSVVGFAFISGGWKGGIGPVKDSPHW